MRASSYRVGVMGLAALAMGVAACAAVSAPNGYGDAGTGGTDTGIGPGIGGAGGGGTGIGTHPTSLTCPVVPQQILILDFRSGWWSGGGGGTFHDVALQAVVQTCANVHAEYHHFETGIQVKCLFPAAGGPGCTELFAPPPATPDGIVALFEKPTWDDYTQVWILSGSALDSTDVTLTGDLFNHFLGQTKGSCTPVLIGAGDGFITHGNAVATELGLGDVLSTELQTPGFFSVFMDPQVTVDSRMHAGAALTSHVLFQGVDSVADAVSNTMKAAHGDSVAEGASTYQVIAHDSSGRPAIAVGAIALPNAAGRPFIIDAGFQRYYGMSPGEGTETLLHNIVKYLGSVGCKAGMQK